MQIQWSRIMDCFTLIRVKANTLSDLRVDNQVVLFSWLWTVCEEAGKTPKGMKP